MSRTHLSASYVATAVQVDCPHCGETLPAPNGSFFWVLDELSTAIEREPNRTCDSCDEPFVLRQQNKAHMSLNLAKSVVETGGHRPLWLDCDAVETRIPASEEV